MLTKRVIPCMDVKDGRVVKGVNFVNLRDAGDPIELAQRYDEQKADEVIFLDITATSDGRATTIDMASRASEELHLPYCVGGGFRSVADIRRRRQGVRELSGDRRSYAHHHSCRSVRHTGDPVCDRCETSRRQS